MKDINGKELNAGDVIRFIYDKNKNKGSVLTGRRLDGFFLMQFDSRTLDVVMFIKKTGMKFIITGNVKENFYWNHILTL